MQGDSLCFAYLGILSDRGGYENIEKQMKIPCHVREKITVEAHNGHTAWEENIDSENLGE